MCDKTKSEKGLDGISKGISMDDFSLYVASFHFQSCVVCMHN